MKFLLWKAAWFFYLNQGDQKIFHLTSWMLIRSNIQYLNKVPPDWTATFFDNIQHYSTIFNIIWQYSTLFDNIRHYLTIFDIIWQYSTLFGNIRQYAALFDNIRHFSTIFYFFWKFDNIRHYSTIFDIIRRNSTFDRQIMLKNVAVHNFYLSYEPNMQKWPRNPSCLKL